MSPCERTAPELVEVMSKEVGLRKTIDVACSQHFGMLR